MNKMKMLMILFCILGIAFMTMDAFAQGAARKPPPPPAPEFQIEKIVVEPTEPSPPDPTMIGDRAVKVTVTIRNIGNAPSQGELYLFQTATEYKNKAVRQSIAQTIAPQGVFTTTPIRLEYLPSYETLVSLGRGGFHIIAMVKPARLTTTPQSRRVPTQLTFPQRGYNVLGVFMTKTDQRVMALAMRYSNPQYKENIPDLTVDSIKYQPMPNNKAHVKVAFKNVGQGVIFGAGDYGPQAATVAYMIPLDGDQALNIERLYLAPTIGYQLAPGATTTDIATGQDTRDNHDFTIRSRSAWVIAIANVFTGASGFRIVKEASYGNNASAVYIADTSRPFEFKNLNIRDYNILPTQILYPPPIKPQ